MSNGNDAAAKQITTIRKLFEDRKASLQEVLPRHLTPERMIKVAINCISKTPALQNCNVTSLYQCILTAAELGLEPGGALGHMYLVPFGSVATPIIGYRGLIELARRSGQLAQIEAHIVHEKDKYRLEFGLAPVMQHIPTLDGDPGKPVLAYMLARLKDGSVHVEVMTWADIMKVKGRSRSAKSGPWVTDEEEMARKTVVRRGMKYLPLSAELAKAFEVDDDDSVEVELVSQSRLAADAGLAGEIIASPANEKAKAAVKARKMQLVDETPQTSINGEPPPDMVLPGQKAEEPPPPTDADAF